MADVEIKGRVTVDTGTTTKSINDMNKSLADSKKALKDLAVGSDEYKKAQADITRQTQELSNATSQSGGAFSKLKDTLNQTVPGFQGASQGASGFGKQLWLLAANPLVLILTAIVAVCTLVYKAFANTAEGGKKMEQVFAGIQAVIQVLTDRLFHLGTAAIKLFSGDFTGAANEAKAAVTGIGDEIEKVYKQTAKITKRLQELKKEQRDDDLDKAQREKRLSVLREQLNDETISAKAKIAIAKELRADQIQNAKDDAKRSKEEANLKITLLSQGTDGAKKNADEINQLRIGVIKTDTDNNMEMIRTNKVIRSLEKQDHSARLAESKELADAKKKAREDEKKAEQDQIDKVVKTIANRAREAKEAQGLQNDLTNADIQLNNEKSQREMDHGATMVSIWDSEYQSKKKNTDEKMMLDELEFNHKRQLSNAIAGIASTLADELGRSTLAGKALAIAGAIIDTWAAVTATLKNSAKSPGGMVPGYAIAQSIAVGIAGLASVKKIVSVQVPGRGSGGGGSVSMPSSPLSPMPERTNTTLDSNSIQGIGNAAKGGVSRSFVLDSDITNNQERNARINRAARLG